MDNYEHYLRKDGAIGFFEYQIKYQLLILGNCNVGCWFQKEITRQNYLNFKKIYLCKESIWKLVAT